MSSAIVSIQKSSSYTRYPEFSEEEKRLFNQQIELTNQLKTYEESTSTAYVYLLACNCNKVGLSCQVTINLAASHFDLSLEEIDNTVSTAYEQHADEFYSVKSFGEESNDDDEDSDEPMALFPDTIFDTLPLYLQKAVSIARTKEERDILLLGSLTTLSVALHRMQGIYGDCSVHPNLYLFISARASAGKGILNHCRQLVWRIHRELREKAKQEKQLYEAEMYQYNVNKAKNPDLPLPGKPKLGMLFIPANNSATGFLQLLAESNERGIIFETEADTLVNSFKSKYGDFSSGFRNAFQHEPVSFFRRTDDEHCEIEHPCLSVLLSGTPNQIQNLIPDVENGLFSRFMFYVMNLRNDWNNVFESRAEQGADKLYEELGDQYYSFYHQLEALPEMCFTLTSDQQERFNAFFTQLQTLYLALQEEDIISSVRRLGLSAFRMMMIFSSLRMMESGKYVQEVVCDDVDFENTLQMISVLAQHSSHVFTQVAKERKRRRLINRKERFLHLLPVEFNRTDFMAVADRLGIPSTTAHRYINDFKSGSVIQKLAHNHYRKEEIAFWTA